jgi:transglutaminase-like putative cysteine protease
VSSRRRLGLIAAAATLLASAPLATIFEGLSWLVQCVVVVSAVAGAAAGARALRAPLWLQTVGMLTAWLVALTWLFPSRQELLGILPTPATLAHFNQLLVQSRADMRDYGIPVPDVDSLLFLTTLGVGLVAVAADVCAVGLRRPAAAGLPMLAIFLVPVAVRFDSVPIIAFAVGAAGFLWLMMSDNIERVRRFGRRFTGDGRDVDPWEPSPLAGAGRRLALIGMAAAVIIPVLIPAPTTGLLEQFGTGTGFGTGSGRGNRVGAVNLFAELSGQLSQDVTQSMVVVETDDEQPHYLRFGVSDQITEDGFINREPTGQQLSDLSEPTLQRGLGISQSTHRASVEVQDAFVMPLLPTYPEVISVSGLSTNWLLDRSNQIVFSSRERSPGLSYEFEYVRSAFSPQALRTAVPLRFDHPVQQQFTEVPTNDYVDDLVAELTEDAATPYDKARAILDHFSRDNGFRYRLETEPGTSGSAIVDFLENKAGYCVQYAAAMAWMARTADLPARVAIGFSRGTPRGNGRYNMTNRNLHAWTEIYLDGFSWVPFDATPASGVQGSVSTSWSPNPYDPDTTSPEIDPSQPTAGPNAPGANGPDDQLPIDGGGSAGGGGPLGSITGRWVSWLIGALVVLLAVFVPALGRLRLRRMRLTEGRRAGGAAGDPAARGNGAGGAAAPTVIDPGAATAAAAAAQRRAHAAWEELLDTMVDFHVPLDPAETPRATVDRLAGHLLHSDRSSTAAGEALGLLGRAEERATYARTPLDPVGFAAALRAVRKALASQTSRWTRTRAALLPPSTLLRWRRTISEAGTETVRTAGRWTATAARVSPRRLLHALRSG